jgi:hypothetical protein
MPLFDRLRLSRSSPREDDGPVKPRPWWRRHPLLSSLVVLGLLGGLLWLWSPWRTDPLCGPGLTAVGSPHVCVGLNLNSTELKPNDQLKDLEKKVAAHNATIRGSRFVTIVVLDDLTPDPANYSRAFQNVRHAIQGAITAAWRANNQVVADGKTPPVKLLLANYGSAGKFQAQAVDAIVRARDRQHIVAVTGFGQSLSTTRKAASDLSNQGIASIGALVSGDNMNTNPANGEPIKRFFRVTPTNSDAVSAAVSYVDKRQYRKVMLIYDKNPQDLYSANLADVFRKQYVETFSSRVPVESPYETPDGELENINRSEFMTSTFAQKHAVICFQKPDSIYFAGRGADLRSFLTALAEGGACSLPPIDVLTSDDATSILGTPLPDLSGLSIRVLYTGVATKGEWNGTKEEWNRITPPQQPDKQRRIYDMFQENEENYNKFEEAFTERFGTADDLLDGYAIMYHDAVLTATMLARRSSSPVHNPKTVANFINELTCLKPVPGASGKIAFSSNTDGNPINKAMPIIQIQPDGTSKMQDLTWAAGTPFDPATC